MSKSVAKADIQEKTEEEAVEAEAQATEEATTTEEKAEESAFTVQFDAALKGFIGATKSSMTYARECANISLQNFCENDGDLSLVYRFEKAISEEAKNYVRLSAYHAWLMAHAPIVRSKERKKLVKDKGEDAVEMDLEGALKVAFWDFAPEKMEEFFTSLDVLTAARALAKRFESDKKKPTNAAAAATVTRFKNVIETLAEAKSA